MTPNIDRSDIPFITFVCIILFFIVCKCTNDAYSKKYELDEVDLFKRCKLLEDFDINIKIDPYCAQIYTGKGLMLAQMNKYPEALKAIDIAIKIDPYYVEAYRAKGYALAMMEKIPEALESYDTVIKLKPDYAEAYGAKGMILASDRIKNYEEALDAFDMAIKLEPDYVDGYLGKGMTFGKQGRYEEALDAFDMAIKLEPDYVDSYINKSSILGKLNKHKKALETYNTALQYEPDNKNALYSKAVTLERLGRQKEAEEVYAQLSNDKTMEEYKNHNLDSIDYVIDSFTNPENESCQKFLWQIRSSMTKHPAFEGLSNEEIHKLIENNLPAVAQKLKIIFNPLQGDK